MTSLPFSNPTTSKAAAESMKPHAQIIRERIISLIKLCGPNGATADEIECELGIQGSTVRPRLVELRAAGRITTEGEVRKTRGGRMALAWVATDRRPADN